MENCSHPKSETVSRIDSYLAANMRTTPPPNKRGTKWLPWQQRLPSNGATTSALAYTFKAGSWQI